MPTDNLLVPSLFQSPEQTQKTISRVLQRQITINYWPSEEAEVSTLPAEEKSRLSRYHYIQAFVARMWQTILPGQHELPSSTWCMWLQIWLGAAVYHLPIKGENLTCIKCYKVIDLFGGNFLANCDTYYVRTARHNKLARVLRDKVFV